MSHHFDTPTGREDPRINLCDFYLFQGAPGKTVMVMTVNPDAGFSAPESLRDEGIYAFRFDLDGDAREEVTFKFRFGEVHHAEGDEHLHVQDFEVRRATGSDALKGDEGDLLVSGVTGQVVKTAAGIKAYAGLKPDLFAGDGAALGAFRTALFTENKFAPEAFLNHKNFFAHRNVTAIVLEVPSELIGHGRVQSWATISLFGHAPEVQVSRWGLPLITNIFIPDQNMREDYNRAGPSEDVARFLPQISQVVEKVIMLAGSAPNPAEYASQFVNRLCPTTLPYTLDTPASFSATEINGRGLMDDAMDVILALLTNTPLGDGVAPDPSRMQAEFPYFGEPYQKADQVGLTPAHPPVKK
jgi:hypothetical protein